MRGMWPMQGGYAMTKPARLGKCNAHEVMEQQLTISVMELVFITFLVFLFFLLSFILIPQTFGFL